MSQCEYKSRGWRQCGRHASHIHTTVRSTTDGGTITRFERRCPNHSESSDKDIHTWTKQRMAAIVVADNLCDADD